MRDGATTHTKQTLGSVSLMRALDAAEKASGWEAGAPAIRGETRTDLGHDDVRPPVSLGTRFAGDTTPEAAE
jgi:hypothetical protein